MWSNPQQNILTAKQYTLKILHLKSYITTQSVFWAFRALSSAKKSGETVRRTATEYIRERSLMPLESHQEWSGFQKIRLLA